VPLETERMAGASPWGTGNTSQLYVPTDLGGAAMSLLIAC
jgi:hypothetical protein